jgi:hypothetical protein
VTVGELHALALSGCFHKEGGDRYTTMDPVRVNGLDVYPHTAGSITIDAANGSIRIDQVEVRAGKLMLGSGSFNWRLTGSGGPVATFHDLSRFHISLFGFGVVGDASLSFQNDAATIPVHFRLPDIFGGITGDAVLHLSNPSGLVLDAIKIHVADAFLGALEVQSLDVEYSGSQPPRFEGSATFLLPPLYSEPGVHVGFGFINGQFKHAEGSFPLTIPLFPPIVYLQKIGLALSPGPLTIKGGVELSGGPQILGTAAVVMDALPEDNGGFTFQLSNPAVLRLEGSMSVVDIPFAHGFVEYRTDGMLKFAGGMDFTLPLDLARLTAGVPETPPFGPGFVDLSTGRFNAPLTGDVCVPASCNVIDIGAQGVISSSGIAACGQYVLYNGPGPTIGVSVGFGYHWGESVHVFGNLGGCDVSSYAVSGHTARHARALSRTILHLGSGLPQENIVVESHQGAPLVTVTAPNGEAVSSATDSLRKSKHMLVVSDPLAHKTYIYIGRPPAGAYTITPQRGSPAITTILHADGLPQPSVRAAVTGSGYVRTLHYTLKPIPGQTVLFGERSATIGADIGAGVATTGTLRWTPAAGPAGRRQVVAVVEQSGVPRREIVVASFVAPPPHRPGKPSFVHVSRHGRRVKVRWGRAEHAVRYLIRLHLQDGTDRQYLDNSTSRLRLTLRGISPGTSGHVAVFGLTLANLRGPARTAEIESSAG